MIKNLTSILNKQLSDRLYVPLEDILYNGVCNQRFCDVARTLRQSIHHKLSVSFSYKCCDKLACQVDIDLKRLSGDTITNNNNNTNF